jgi:DNA-binding NtrC family response regulator
LLDEIQSLATGHQGDRAHRPERPRQRAEAIALGAYDFCPKPFEPDILTLTIDGAYRVHELQEENRRLQDCSRPRRRRASSPATRRCNGSAG